MYLYMEDFRVATDKTVYTEKHLKWHFSFAVTYLFKMGCSYGQLRDLLFLNSVECCPIQRQYRTGLCCHSFQVNCGVTETLFELTAC